ncbi:hypothetical protein [Clostridium estertheticum]|uniref:hypothetical protein n=1 Tax=Clostridium estertheticum TaxID=238834 RepID=UPI001C6F16EF|nr:hypothetical protein [Clostridium estertheticum]MBW9154276.1 hypothetical protein [Clostridium estertheticum]WLC86702.1 hypothetical protein KTC97_22025 [Clostridium estertheticum]
MDTIVNVLYPVLSVVITGTVIPFVVKLLISHIKAINLAKDIKLAGLIWDALNEDGRMGELVTDKLTAFKNMMKFKTDLSDEDILLLNKSLAGVANAGKDAIIKAVIPEGAIAPTVKYFDKDGKELVIKA